MSIAINVHAAFVRATEGEYGQRVAAHLAKGLTADQAHTLAFESVKHSGWEVLHELRHRGQIPGPHESDLHNEGRHDAK